jgi:hypothetical protein
MTKCYKLACDADNAVSVYSDLQDTVLGDSESELGDAHPDMHAFHPDLGNDS